jgi:hypothetical protein
MSILQGYFGNVETALFDNNFLFDGKSIREEKDMVNNKKRPREMGLKGVS